MNRQDHKQVLRLYLGMLLSVLIASLFFSSLYYFNNKYTQRTTQPINGLLLLSEADMEQQAVISGMIGRIIPMCF